jgi:hypothetical protein
MHEVSQLFGSVPASRTASQLPPSNTSLRPSRRSISATSRPAILFHFCFSRRSKICRERRVSGICVRRK